MVQDTPREAASAIVPEWRKRVEAIHRAVPLSRMLDYGMSPADARALRRRTLKGEEWDVVGEEFADRLADLGDHRTAAATLMIAQLAYNFDEPRKVALYERGAAQFARFASSQSNVRATDLSYNGQKLHGWSVTPPDRGAEASIVIVGGLSGWSWAFFGMAEALANHGFAVVLAEGPGQGLTRMREGVFLRRETFRAMQAFVDHAGALTPSGRVGICGNSFGGLIAAWTAATSTRVGACCINGAPSVLQPPTFRTAAEQICAATGLEDDEALAEALVGLSFPFGEHSIDCPILILEGGADPMVPLGAQRAFLEAGSTGDHTVRTWPDGEHTIYNHPAERNSTLATWFAERLAASARA